LKGRAKEVGIDLEFAIPTSLPLALADPERIAHVFDNLIRNALNHTASGGRIRVSAKQGANGDLEFLVADSGEGIPAEHLGRVFEKFYRVPGSRHRGGVGLGLAITREIVSGHGGQIKVKSYPRRGHRVHLYIAGRD